MRTPEQLEERALAKAREERIRDFVSDGEPLAWVNRWFQRSSPHKGLPDQGREHLFHC